MKKVEKNKQFGSNKERDLENTYKFMLVEWSKVEQNK